MTTKTTHLKDIWAIRQFLSRLDRDKSFNQGEIIDVIMAAERLEKMINA